MVTHRHVLHVTTEASPSLMTVHGSRDHKPDSYMSKEKDVIGERQAGDTPGPAVLEWWH